jgi:hypothetical protein
LEILVLSCTFVDWLEVNIADCIDIGRPLVGEVGLESIKGEGEVDLFGT